MLRNRNGLLVNSCILTYPLDFSKLMQSERTDEAIRVPAKGAPLTKDAVLGLSLYANKPVTIDGTAVKKGLTQSFRSQFYDEGVVIERFGDRIAYLEYVAANSSGRIKKDAAAQVERLKRSLGNIPMNAISRVYAVDQDGRIYASSSGIFQQGAVALADIHFSSGKSLDAYLSDYASKESGGDKIKSLYANLAIRQVPEFSTDVGITETSVRETLGLVGLILTTRGLARSYGSTEDVISEFRLVCEPLLDKLGERSLTAWDMPWALSSFSRLKLSETKRMVANFVGGYLTASVNLLSVNATGDTIMSTGQIPLGTALSQGKWSFSNNTHSVRLNNDVFTIDPQYNDVIAKALTLTADEVSAIIGIILDAAQVYGLCMGDKNNWTSAMWAEWLGVTGLIGALAINAAR